MNLGDFGLAVMLIVSLVAMVVGVVVFGSVALVIGVRRMVKAWW